MFLEERENDLGTIHIFRNSSGAALDCRSMGSVERQDEGGLFHHHAWFAGFPFVYHLDVDLVGTSAIAYDGRDTSVVFVLSAFGRYHRLFTMEVQVDTLVLYLAGVGVYLR